MDNFFNLSHLSYERLEGGVFMVSIFLCENIILIAFLTGVTRGKISLRGKIYSFKQ